MATDKEETPAVKLNKLRRKLGLLTLFDEATAQAQTRALEPLTLWLRNGTESPEVVIRAVQALLADPEEPSAHVRPAVDEIIRQVADSWASAGAEKAGILGLQLMLIAAWPDKLNEGQFALVPLFNSALSALQIRSRQSAQVAEWQRALTGDGVSASTPSDALIKEPDVVVTASFLGLPDPDSNMQYLEKHQDSNMDFSDFGAQLNGVLDSHRAALRVLDERTESLVTVLKSATSSVADAVERASNKMNAKQEFLWWGQSRYSHSERRPYRRIEDGPTRLWWMAWEASELALTLDVEPSASFFVEVLHQMGENVSEKRPLIAWLSDLFQSLQTLHEHDHHAERIALGGNLKKIATKDALGMPVTWARLEAASNRHRASTFEQRARHDIALDLDTVLDRGDWAVWLFREALLDRHLRNA